MRSMKSLMLLFFLALALIVLNALLWAGSNGKIAGVITDELTGKPIVGASVLIIGTNLGAMTDVDGKYEIKDVKPGVYRLMITAIGYTKVEVIEIEVKADMTFEQSVKMIVSNSEIDATIIVKGKKDILNIQEVASQQTITKEVIKHAPVTTVDELLSSVVGVQASRKGEVYIRGGRVGEVSYMYDGTPMNDPMGGLSKSGAKLHLIQPDQSGWPPVHGGSSIVNGKPFDAMFFENYGTNPFVDTEDDHFSTFAIDVDDASYIMARSYLERGYLPQKEAVRVEEFINHFDYRYEAPRSGAFKVYVDGSNSRFGTNSSLLRIGIKGKEVNPEERKAANLVFVIDVSGSMRREDRLGLVKKGLRLLVDQLRPDDQVGIVIYGSKGKEWLRPTSIKDRWQIINAIEKLQSMGSTNAEEGIRLGYKMADRCFDQRKINRVILCSDGVANVGRTGPDEILKQIKAYAKKGITLSAIGFGMGNYNDVLMEKLGNKGDGNYAYVDDLDEAKRVFVENLTGMLQVIARDVKIQVDFNPNVVRSYRLLGYENRDVADKDFRVDSVDGGEIGAGHEVTALYEVKLKQEPTDGYLGRVHVRFKDPQSFEVTEYAYNMQQSVLNRQFEYTSSDFRLSAVAAEFAEILRKSYWARDSKLSDLRDIVQVLAMENESQQVLELMEMISKAQQFDEELAVR